CQSRSGVDRGAGPEVALRSRLRSWPPGRRSGCSPAEPYPPPGPTAILARGFGSRNLPRRAALPATRFPRLLQFAVPFGEDHGGESRELVQRRHVTDRAVETLRIVVIYICDD